jgi:hypothetical protein
MKSRQAGHTGGHTNVVKVSPVPRRQASNAAACCCKKALGGFLGNEPDAREGVTRDCPPCVPTLFAPSSHAAPDRPRICVPAPMRLPLCWRMCPCLRLAAPRIQRWLPGVALLSPPLALRATSPPPGQAAQSPSPAATWSNLRDRGWKKMCEPLMHTRALGSRPPRDDGDFLRPIQHDPDQPALQESWQQRSHCM